MSTQQMLPYNRLAFTLVELALVLVLIGLVAGGIAVGSAMVQQARLSSVLEDFAKHKAAVTQFRSQYNGKPGDLRDAESYFGTDPSGCPSNSNRTPHATTCNGDGDGSISATNETWRAWQQLAAAAMIEGQFSGVAGAGGSSEAVAGSNVPASRVQGGAYYLITFNPGTANSNYYAPLSAGEAVFFGKAATGTWPSGAILTPLEQAQLDTKFDDGKPASGHINALKSLLNPGCTTSDTASADYNLASGNSTACSMLFLLND